MTTERKSTGPVSGLRLQTLIDMHKRQYIRERGDPNVFDTYSALVELQVMRRALAEATQGDA